MLWNHLWPGWVPRGLSIYPGVTASEKSRDTLLRTRCAIAAEESLLLGRGNLVPLREGQDPSKMALVAIWLLPLKQSAVVQP